MIENCFSIPASDSKRIYYILNQAAAEKTGKAIIIGHGLTGHPAEYLHQIATQYFLAKGYDVYRIAFYSDATDARKLFDCTLEIHASDLNTLIGVVSKDYTQVFVAGHSYGGLTTLIANPSVTAIAFWDSTYTPVFWSDAIPVPELSCFKLEKGSVHLIGTAMIEEAQKYTRAYSMTLAKRIRTPSIAIFAEIKRENARREALYEDLTCQKETAEVKGASHTFWETGVAEKLAQVTEVFFSKIARNGNVDK